MPPYVYRIVSIIIALFKQIIYTIYNYSIISYIFFSNRSKLP